MPAFAVIVADDHQVVRAGLRQILDAQDDLTVVAECSSGAETIQALAAQHCHVLLLDLSLPDMSGLEVLHHAKSHCPHTGILVLSAYPEKQFGLNVVRAGASGFIGKECDEAELLRAIRAVARGGRYVGAALAEQLMNGVNGDGGQPLHSMLSEREFQIFCRLAEGQKSTEIARKLFLSVKTVSTYRSRLLEKMNMRSNAEIAQYAVKNGLV